VTETRKARLEIGLLFLLFIIILPRQYMDYDMSFWRQWALYIHEHGVSNAYNSGTNYLPVYIYILYAFDLMQGSAEAISRNIWQIKLVPMFFDFLPFFVLCCFRQRLFPFKTPYLFILLNIAYLFNSMIWGQIDSIFTNLCFLAIIVAFRYPVAAILLFLLALNTKLQAIVLLPVLGCVLVYSIRNVKTAVIGLISAIALQTVILLPFLSNGAIDKITAIPIHAVDLFPKLSICAFNIWYIIEPGNPYFIDDKATYFILSYKQIGLILFFGFSAAVLLPLLFRLLRHRRQEMQPDTNTWELLFLSTGLASLYFFYFNSQMHERYAHPIIIFFFFYAVLSKNYIPFILSSIAYFLSLDKCFPDFLPIKHYKIIFASRVIAAWYTVALAYTTIVFIRKFPLLAEWKALRQSEARP
jgi:Gpi18-like mannosyltransferase